MKRRALLTITALLLCVGMTVGFTACTGQEDIDKATNEATAPLREQITALEAKITALEGEKSAITTEKEAILEAKEALEAEKAALGEEKAALEATLAEKEIEIACAKGEHVWDGESELQYDWSLDYTKCTVIFDCINCEDAGEVVATSISSDEKGNPVATFDGGFPSHTRIIPKITAVTFNTDSEDYDEDTDTFTVSPGQAFVITFTGADLDLLGEEFDYIVAIQRGGTWFEFDRIYNARYPLATIEKNRITYTWNYNFASQVVQHYGSITGFALFDANSRIAVTNAFLDITLETKILEVDSEGYTVVRNVAELEVALNSGGKIRLGANIEKEKSCEIYKETVVDLAGYDLIVTGEYQASFLLFENCELIDSVGGSKLYKNIRINKGILKFRGNIVIESTNVHFSGSGTLDLSNYTGGELYVYATHLEDVILPEGYAFYDSVSGEKLADLEAARAVAYVDIRPEDDGAIAS